MHGADYCQDCGAELVDYDLPMEDSITVELEVIPKADTDPKTTTGSNAIIDEASTGEASAGDLRTSKSGAHKTEMGKAGIGEVGGGHCVQGMGVQCKLCGSDAVSRETAGSEKGRCLGCGAHYGLFMNSGVRMFYSGDHLRLVRTLIEHTEKGFYRVAVKNDLPADHMAQMLNRLVNDLPFERSKFRELLDHLMETGIVQTYLTPTPGSDYGWFGLELGFDHNHDPAGD